MKLCIDVGLIEMFVVGVAFETLFGALALCFLRFPK